MEASKFEMTERFESSSCDEHGDYQQKITLLMGREIKTRCPECQRIQSEKYAAEKLAAEEIEKQARIERRLNAVGIPHRFRGKVFSNYIADTSSKKKALETANAFADNFQDHFERGTTAIFSGTPGTGKSHLALAIASQIMDRYTAFYINALDAIRMVRDTWRRDSDQSETEVLKTFGEIDLLIIDEVGNQYGSEGEQVIMFDIINRRYRDMMPTILLSNLGQKGLKEYLGDRSFDRLREDGIWVAFDWESYRAKKAA